MRQLFKLIIISTLLFGCVKPIKGDLLIENVNVIDVQTGDLKTNFDVLLINDSIAKIQKHKQGKYNASKRIDGTDKYLILGLWDMHSHWIDTYEYFFPMMLSNGVVGIRDMWGNFPVLGEVRQKIADGELIGPDIFSAGFLVAGENPFQAGASDIAATPEEGRWYTSDRFQPIDRVFAGNIESGKDDGV